MGTPDRDALHQLVDTLPEAALESVERALQHFQTWPPERHPDAEKLHQRLQKLMGERTGQMGGSSTASFFGDGDGVASAYGCQGRDNLSIELRRFRGHELQIERRLGVSEDKRKLLYALLIKGPDGKEGHHEFEFDIADASTPPL
jgi:hypothetical protein